MAQCKWCGERIGIFELSVDGLHRSCLRRVENNVKRLGRKILEAQQICLETHDYNILKSRTSSIIKFARQLQQYEPLDIMNPTPSEIIAAMRELFCTRGTHILADKCQEQRETGCCLDLTPESCSVLRQFRTMVGAIGDAALPEYEEEPELYTCCQIYDSDIVDSFVDSNS